MKSSSRMAPISGPIPSSSRQAVFELEGVHQWVSATTLSKRHARKKEREKSFRDTVDEKKPTLKERLSSRNMRASPTDGPWKKVSLKLEERLKEHNNSAYILRVYDEDDNQDTVLLHLLSVTDIRPVDRTMFNLADCIGIHNHIEPTPSSEPIYIHFPSTQTMNNWLNLLHSCAIPEAYGLRFVDTSQGGLYRMWRSLDIEILNGRNIGIGSVGPKAKYVPSNLKMYDSAGFGGGGNPMAWLPEEGVKGSFDDPLLVRQTSEESLDGNIFCEIYIGGELCARSSAQRGGSASSDSTSNLDSPMAGPIWDESFSFPGLPSFVPATEYSTDNNSVVRIVVRRAHRKSTSLTLSGLVSKGTGKKTLHPPQALPSPGLLSSAPSSFVDPLPLPPPPQTSSAEEIGTVEISLTKFRRGQKIHGYFPVITPLRDNGSGGLHLGDLRLNVTVEEEVIMPHRKYEALSDVFQRRNPLHIIADLFECQSDPGTAPDHIIHIAASQGTLIRSLCEVIDTEIEAASNAPETLFRGRTALTSVLQKAMLFYGRAFLDLCIGPVIRQIMDQSISVNVGRASDNIGEKELANDISEVVKWSQATFDGIYNHREQCPSELTTVFLHIRSKVEEVFRGKPSFDLLRWQGVTAFFFLRFVTPAFHHPQMYGLTSGNPSLGVKRTLTEISKAVQKVSNLNPPIAGTMSEPLFEFVKQNIPAMSDYVRWLSSPRPIPYANHAMAEAPKDSFVDQSDAIARRVSSLPTLHRESIAKPPHMLDEAKYLAALVSSIVRNARAPRQAITASDIPSDEALERVNSLILLCASLESETLTAVKKLDPRKVEPAKTYIVRGKQVTVPPSSAQNHSSMSAAQSPTSPVSPRMVFSRAGLDNGSSSSEPPHMLDSSRPSTAPSSRSERSNEPPALQGRRTTEGSELPPPPPRSRHTQSRQRLQSQTGPPLPLTITSSSLPSQSHRTDRISPNPSATLGSASEMSSTGAVSDGGVAESSARGNSFFRSLRTIHRRNGV